ncbi:MAG TPA: FtsX-like permease family protein [Candidatus Latescibacteria bacterium]|nr:FtsX-like permease family protein [Candidatus Latescibacterota bacterium]
MDEQITHEEAIRRLRTDMRTSSVATPFATALKIAFQSLRIRFWRSIITIAGIFFAIAFLVSVLNSAVVELAVNPDEGSQVSGTGLRFILTLLAAEPRQAWLVTMSLIVCVIGIANAMLMSVTERYKEIGTMKCLGALDIFVIELFLLESGFQGLVGSFTGALIGAALVLVSALVKHGFAVMGILPWSQMVINILLATVIGLLLTLLGASFPAYRASQMPPADAMRTEV